MTTARLSFAARRSGLRRPKGCRVPLHGFIVEVLSGIAGGTMGRTAGGRTHDEAVRGFTRQAKAEDARLSKRVQDG